MGLARGIAAKAGELRDNIFITVDVRLDHALTVNIEPPTQTSRGPDRAQASVAIRVGNQGFALLPEGNISRLLPLTSPLQFVGVPALVGSLAGTEYITTARTVTGEAGGVPRSVVGSIASTTTSAPVIVNSFVQIPVLAAPALNETWDGSELKVTRAAGGASPDLVLLDVESGSGLVNWQIVAPGSKSSVKVPDLRQVLPEAALISGPLSIAVSLAQVKDFNYGNLRYRELGERGWTAHATDVFYAKY
jgi:hypothetical protein